MTENTSIVVAALYKFVQLNDYQQLQSKILRFCQQENIKGTLLLAEEGINGTIAGKRENIDSVLSSLKSDPRLTDLEHKESFVDGMPFLRMKVKLKKEIVTLGQPDINPIHQSGIRVEPQDWNEIISDPEVLVIDTRNQYENDIGTFKGAVSPNTNSFREFPDYVEHELDPNKHKKVAMFCTGGIRCEKASSYMLNQGFEEVFQLNGGILKYLEEVEKDESLWQGQCFVFDNRVAVDHDLAEGMYEQCYACRRPITEEDVQSTNYIQGVSCPHCINETTEEQRSSFRERQRQIDLAKRRGEEHIGINRDT